MFEKQTKVIEDLKRENEKTVKFFEAKMEAKDFEVERLKKEFLEQKIKIEVLEKKIIEHTSDPKEFECKYCRKRYLSKGD